MADGVWGHCRSCKFFGSPAHAPLGSEEARCMHAVLSQYELIVFGASGCNGWELRPGLSPQIEEQPSAG